MKFVTIPTMPLEQRVGFKKTPIRMNHRNNDDVNNENSGSNNNNDTYKQVDDGRDLSIPSHEFRTRLQLPTWRQHSNSELLLLDNSLSTGITLDRISEFGIRPPELRVLFDTVGNYFRWFHISQIMIDEERMNELVVTNIHCSHWVDGIMRVIKVRLKALEEIMVYINSLELTKNEDNPRIVIMNIFKDIYRLHKMNLNQSIEQEDCDTWKFYSQIIIEDPVTHLPVPVFSYIKPTMGAHFILHLLLSLGHFDTEYDLILHRSIRESLRYAKLIGLSDDEDLLRIYSKKLLCSYIENQLVYFPNSTKVTDSWIMTAKDLLDNVIIRDKIKITDMPPVLQCDL